MFKFRWPSGLNRRSDHFFRAMPLRAKIRLYAGIFFCFAPMGLLQETMTLRLESAWAVAARTAYAGGVASFFAWIMLNHTRWFPVPLAILFLAPIGLNRILPPGLSPVELDAAGLEMLSARLKVVSVLSIACMAGAYISFLALVQREGLRYSSAHAEIRLAREIHATLVPDVSGHYQHLSWRGRSRPVVTPKVSCAPVVRSAAWF